jgi:hypothetical protein
MVMSQPHLKLIVVRQMFCEPFTHTFIEKVQAPQKTMKQHRNKQHRNNMKQSCKEEKQTQWNIKSGVMFHERLPILILEERVPLLAISPCTMCLIETQRKIPGLLYDCTGHTFL